MPETPPVQPDACIPYPEFQPSAIEITATAAYLHQMRQSRVPSGGLTMATLEGQYLVSALWLKLQLPSEKDSSFFDLRTNHRW
jgi:hypothetical protein